MLTDLRASGLTLGLVSNTFVPPQVLDRHLQQEGMLDQLPLRVYSCQVGIRKPRPEIFRLALEQAALTAPRTLFVGDSPRTDIVGANRVGMISVLKDPTGRHANGRAKPNHLIRSILELPRIIDEYNRPG
jgi:FMN phosphatase YigB (HAD superfamily)